MQVADPKDHLCNVELDITLNESFLKFQSLVKLAALDKWHDKVQPQIGLEKVV